LTDPLVSRAAEGGLAPRAGLGPNLPGNPVFVERRKRPTPMLSRFTFHGGRRRAHPGEEGYVDLYSRRASVLVLLFFALTVFDAMATVFYIDHIQGSEWNPIADWLLRQGRMVFVLGKGIPTAILLLFVMIHKNFRYGRLALLIGFGFYLLLGIYHLVLQAMSLAIDAGFYLGALRVSAA
jgi:hypothetical protein